MKRAILLVAKAPILGKVKTRLVPAIGAELATELYSRFLSDIIERCEAVDAADKFLFYYPLNTASMFSHYMKDGMRSFPQEGHTFGHRMHNAFRKLHENGYERMVIIGSDCPVWPAGGLMQAFEELSTHDITIGRAADGGFYMMGLKQPVPDLFTEVTFSTATVFRDMMRIAAQLQLCVSELPPWYDIDVGEDLKRLYRDLLANPELSRQAPRTTAFLEKYKQKISIINSATS